MQNVQLTTSLRTPYFSKNPVNDPNVCMRMNIFLNHLWWKYGGNMCAYVVECTYLYDCNILGFEI